MLSGGERSRLELALLGIMPSNLLLLDEPTNHLDIPAREAIEAFMTDSPATLLIVSHDRRLLETVCDRLWVVDAGLAAPFDGGYEAWRAAVAGRLDGRMRRSRQSPPACMAAVHAAPHRQGRQAPAWRLRAGRRRPAKESAVAVKPSSPAKPFQPRARQPKLSKDAYRKQRALVDSELTRLGLRKNHLELALGDPAVGSNFVELRRITSELADVVGRPGGRRGSLAGARGPGPVTRPLRLGLTGPIGCGKSTVLAWLAARGALVIDADQVAREVTSPGSPVTGRGRRRVRPGGHRGRWRASIARRSGRSCSAIRRELRRLEAITHPVVRERILAALASGRGTRP